MEWSVECGVELACGSGTGQACDIDERLKAERLVDLGKCDNEQRNVTRLSLYIYGQTCGCLKLNTISQDVLAI